MSEVKNRAGPELLPASEVARCLSVSVRTVYRMVRRGQVPPPIRFNRKLVRWRSCDIQNCLDQVEKRAS